MPTSTPERPAGVEAPRCRGCGAGLSHTFVDLGMSPLANSYVPADRLQAMEPFYPLHVQVCDRCFLVQLQPVTTSEAIFSDYAYFSSYSDSWLEHARRYTDAVVARFGLGPDSRVVEIASNDGYLLQYFVARGIDVLGIEPARNVAQAALERGIPTEIAFFGHDFARRLAARRPADLIVGNNVLAHVPDLGDFVDGLKALLAPGGVITLEFPHLLCLMAENQFDTIYHEHFSYFSLLSVDRVMAARGLAIFDVERLPTHGGSLRIYVGHAGEPGRQPGGRVAELLEIERAEGLETMDAYRAFGKNVERTKRKLLEFLIDAKARGKTIAGYGAPAKGNTLLNYCGIRSDFIDYTVDRSPHKQGQFLPGTHIPICHPDRIRETRPDYVLILPWNLAAEIIVQMRHVGEWDGRFVVPIPEVRVIEAPVEERA